MSASDGEVWVKKAGGDREKEAKPLPYALWVGDSIHTDRGSSAVITFDDGAKVRLNPGTSFTITDKSPRTVLSLSAGRIKAWVFGALKKNFDIKTPVAIAAVRGTEFDVAYEDKKEMLVEVYDGLIGVRDLVGQEVMVASGERLKVLPGRPLERPERIEGRVFPDPKSEIRREVSLGLSKDEVQAAAAHEARLAEYQEGKTLVDVFGKRVRLEEYIIRPRPDQFKLVVLNDRDSRFDYFYYLGTFNQTLPSDLRLALKDVNGATGPTPPDFYLTAYETGRSNTQDVIQENASGGHLIQSTLPQDKAVYHADTDSFQTVTAGTLIWLTLFDNYSYKVNGTEWFGWQPLPSVVSNISAYDYTQFETRIAGSLLGTDVGATIACANDSDCTSKEQLLRPSTITNPDGADVLHQQATIGYKSSLGGAVLYSETYDFYTADDRGSVAHTSDFAGVLSGASYLATLLKFNYEEVITNNVFGGRKIDLVVEPKILIRSGLLQ